MQKARGTHHRLTEEHFRLIKTLSPNRATSKIAKAIGPAIGMSGATVVRASTFQTWEDYLDWKKELAVKQSEKKHFYRNPKVVLLPEKKSVAESDGSLMAVCNELVAIKRLLEKLLEVWQPKNPEPRMKFNPFRGL